MNNRLLELIETSIQEATDRARDSCHAHWAFLKMENEGRLKPDWGHHGPRVLEARNSVYIYWHLFPKRTKRAANYGIRIQPTKKGYTKALFKKAHAWELELISQTEHELKIHRHELKALCDMRTIYRRYLRIAEAKKGESNGE